MKNTDDGTLSLFGDELPPATPIPAPAKAAKPPAEKKPRAKRKPKEVAPEVTNDADVVKEEVLGQANPLVLRATVEPQQRRNSP